MEPHRRKKSPKDQERLRIRSAFEGGDLGMVALMWAEGQHVEWEVFYGAAPPQKLPLPTYPFAKERYWVSDSPRSEERVRPQTKPSQLHPLVAHNASTLKEVCFASSLSSKEYYARDHQVNGELFFPGAGFLEIACVAGTIAGEEAVARIEDIVWMHPLCLTSGDQVIKTFLKPSGNHVEFAIVSFNEDNERIVHSEGRISYGRCRNPHAVQPSYSIQELKLRADRTVQGSDCYRRLEGFGFRYGPCFQTIQEMHVGSDFVLAKLKLAEDLKDDFDQYILHPCIIDGALQTVIGLAANGRAEPGESDTPYLPFALGQVEVLRPLSESCYVHVDRATSKGHSDVMQFNIRILNDSGEVLARLDNFYVRALPRVAGHRLEEVDALAVPE
jgi:polyketide synthase PksN